MSIYLNAALMLVVTLAAFVVLAALWQAVRQGGFRALSAAFRRPATLARLRVPLRRLRVEEVCQLDARRRLSLVTCDGQALLLLTGGPTDLVVCRLSSGTLGAPELELPL